MNTLWLTLPDLAKEALRTSSAVRFLLPCDDATGHRPVTSVATIAGKPTSAWAEAIADRAKGGRRPEGLDERLVLLHAVLHREGARHLQIA